jgi:putative iron-only hydrogenase system regulator
MQQNYYTITITVYERSQVFSRVSELLHEYADYILLRVGHPIKELNIAVIFLLLKMTSDELGAFSGRLGQLNGVKVKSTLIKT